MSELRGPLRDRMRCPLGEPDVQRMWRTIEAKRARAVRRPFRLAYAGLALACAGLFAVLVVLGSNRDEPRVRTCDEDPAACLAKGPLTLADGREIGPIEGTKGDLEPARFELSDGSAIELSRGAKLLPLENTATAFSALLSEGRGEFQVKKGGPRRWSIECGLGTVEVVGTHFRVDRSPGRVHVDLFEGIVLVRGERLPDRVRKLLPGESVDIEEARAPNPAPESSDEPPAAGSSASRVAPKTPAAASAAWQDHARRGAYGDAYKALGAAGLAREASTSDVDGLFLLADIARLSGHPAEAIAPLSKIVRERAKDPRAAIAAFTMGRIQLDSLKQPDRAAGSFQASVDLGLTEPLIEDAVARIVEARARAGDQAGAREALAEYERRFPKGRRAVEARRWVEEK